MVTDRTATATAIRSYREDDFDGLVARWHETNRASYAYVEEQQRHTLEDAQRFFRQHLVPSCEIWVAENESELLGLLALDVSWIRQFAVFPGHQRHGVGTLLLRAAQRRSPRELRLYTFRRNAPARAFYQKHGFAPVAFGVSPAPESEPDVEYRWTGHGGDP